MVNPWADTVSVGVSRQLGADMAINVDVVNTKSNAFNAGVQINTPRQRRAAASRSGAHQPGAVDRMAEVPRAARAPREAVVQPLPVHACRTRCRRSTDNSFGATSTGTITDFYHPEYDAGYGNADRRHAMVASGAYLLPGDVTLGMVWTLRSTAPFSAQGRRGPEWRRRQHRLRARARTRDRGTGTSTWAS